MISYFAICFYYYLLQGAKVTAKAAAILAGAFVIHKLVSWGLWVLSL